MTGRILAERKEDIIHYIKKDARLKSFIRHC